MNLSRQLIIVEQHAEQLRAEVMEMLWSAGAEYTEAMMDQIALALESAKAEENINKIIFTSLAEIGWCDVFCRSARAKIDEGE